jgi:hypothetical protein
MREILGRAGKVILNPQASPRQKATARRVAENARVLMGKKPLK